MPLQATSGAASYDGFGGGVAAVPNYIEECFSTTLYTGTGATQSINNGIDESGKGALTWIKDRGAASTPHMWFDTTRGVGKYIQSNSTGAQGNIADTLTAFNSNGFTVGADSFGVVNASGHTYSSWTFRKQPKFFDVVTYTGNGTNGRTVAHNLGSAPGCIIIKRTSFTGPWYTWHRSLTADKVVYLNTTAAQADPPFGAGSWISSDSTTVTFPNVSIADVNNNGYDYVMYIFAHNAGGFGLTGTDNVISCGSFTAGSNSAAGSATINLGYEPQWILTKNATGTSTANWQIYDNMRGITAANTPSYPTANALAPNTSGAESDTGIYSFNSTGFVSHGGYTNGDTIIYIAIRRGPMKVPTDATKVFAPVAYTGSGSGATGQTITAGFPIDLASYRYTNQSYGGTLTDRLRGFTGTSSKALYTYATAAEATDTEIYGGDSNTSIKSYGFSASYNFIGWYWRRAPSFFDEVCYTGTGSSGNVQSHNLGVVPELLIIKKRSSATNSNWLVDYYVSATQGAEGYLNLTGGLPTVAWTSTSLGSAPTATNFSVGNYSVVNESGGTFVAYLFATCAGVSKVGSYTGTGTTLQVNCGFTAGARFVLIKRTDSTGAWYVWDSARGIVSGNDPYILLNNDLAQVTSTDYIDTYSAGFEISSTAPAAINASGGTFIFLAIA